MATMDFNAFPVEIQFRIFEHLTPFEMQHFVSPTCKRWHAIASLPFFWKQLSFNGEKHTSQQIRDVFKRSPFAQRASFYRIANFSWLQDLSAYIAVTQLTFKSCELSNIIMEEFVRIFPYLREIHITFGKSVVDNSSIIYQITRMNAIETIILHKMNNINGNQLDMFSNKCQNLKAFSLGSTINITDNSLTSFIKLKGKYLNVLAIISGLENVTTKSFQAIAQCSSLRQLILGGIGKSMTDAHFANFQSLKFLSYLSLRGAAELFSDQFVTIFKDVSFSTLAEITIYKCANLTRSTLRALIESCSILKILRLCRLKNLSDDDFVDIADCCKRLEYLGLNNVDKVTESCVTFLAENLPLVKHIRVGNCRKIRKRIHLVVTIKRHEVNETTTEIICKVELL